MNPGAQLESQVPRLSDARVLRLLRVTKEKNRARFVLASLALTRLYRVPTGAFPRTTLFSPIRGSSESKSIVDEGKSESWQKSFLQRLEQRGLVTSNDGRYALVQEHRDEIGQIALEAFDGDGSGLKRLLWPQDYEEPEFQESDAAPGHQDGDVLHDLTVTLTALVESMKATAEGVAAVEIRQADTEKRISRLGALDERLGAKVDEVLSSVDRIAEVATAFNSASEKYDSLIRVLEDDKRRQLAVLCEKIQESAGRKRSVMNQLDSTTGKEAELVDTLKRLLGETNDS